MTATVNPKNCTTLKFQAPLRLCIPKGSRYECYVFILRLHRRDSYGMISLSTCFYLRAKRPVTDGTFPRSLFSSAGLTFEFRRAFKLPLLEVYKKVDHPKNFFCSKPNFRITNKTKPNSKKGPAHSRNRGEDLLITRDLRVL